MESELRSDPALARSVLGTDDPRRIADALGSFCASRLGSSVRRVLFCEISVGAAFGLLLGDGRRVFLKAHPPARGPNFLRAVHRPQGHLARRGFPCPGPVVGPEPFLSGHATVDEYADAGSYRDAHDPAIRREMARALARQVELCSGLPGVGALAEGGMRWPEGPQGALWPEPHNVLFDFEATAQGAGWIDRIALAARRARPEGAGEIVVGHRDWSAKHFRFEDRGGAPRLRVVYDWDALSADREPIIVGFAAATFTATWYLKVRSRAPSPWEAERFVSEYEGARGEPFSGPERSAAFCTAVYMMAYVARCEHAVDPAGEDLRASFRRALCARPDGYLGLFSAESGRGGGLGPRV